MNFNNPGEGCTLATEIYIFLNGKLKVASNLNISRNEFNSLFGMRDLKLNEIHRR